MTPKQQMQSLLDQLPDDCSLEQLQTTVNSIILQRTRYTLTVEQDTAVFQQQQFGAQEKLSHSEFSNTERNPAKAYSDWQEMVSI